MSQHIDELDEFGRWTGTCPDCDTNHDGAAPGTFGGLLTCLRTQAEQLGATDIVEQVDRWQEAHASVRERLLRREGLIP